MRKADAFLKHTQMFLFDFDILWDTKEQALRQNKIYFDTHANFKGILVSNDTA
jgi:hypothetical protein